MKGNLMRQADLRLRIFCHGLTLKQRKAVLYILFVPFAVGCICTAYRPFMGGKGQGSGLEFMEKDSLCMEFIQTIVGHGERENQESDGTADEAVQVSAFKGREAAE